MLVSELKKKIAEWPARSMWAKGRREYAKELFNSVVEMRCLADTDDFGAEITIQEMLNDAPNWEQYSNGGCSLIRDRDIIERLCPPSIQKQKNPKPIYYDATWLDTQARALAQAATLVRMIVNGGGSHVGV